MRYNQRATFVQNQGEHYDAELGKVVKDGIKRTIVPCFVTSVSLEVRNLLGDKLQDDSLVIHIRKPIGKVDFIEYDGRPFSIIRVPNHLQSRTVFYVNEVLNG